MQPDCHYPPWKYNGVVTEQRCACRTSSENDRGRAPENPYCQTNRAIVTTIPADLYILGHAQRVWKAASSQYWLGMCDVPPIRADFPENDPEEASDLPDRQSVQSTARWSAPTSGACVPVPG